MNKSLSFLLMLCFLTAQSGCATIVSGRTQDVMIRSNPTGADILIDGAMSGATPMLANLARNKRHTIKISKSGYPEVTRATTRGFNWWFLGNLIFGGIIGIILDPITGAVYAVKPDEIYVDLNQDTPSDEVEFVEEAPEVETA